MSSKGFDTWGLGNMADIFKCIFVNENVLIWIQISLKFVRKGPINNIPVLVQKMTWRRPGDKSLSEPMMVSLLTHKCVTLPQWVNALLDVILNQLTWQKLTKRALVTHTPGKW